jgi:hypothetical protein
MSHATNPDHDPAVPHPDPRVHGAAHCPHRCGDCPHGRHHWIESGFDPTDWQREESDDAERAVMDYDRDHGTEHALAYGACKHCPAWCEGDVLDEDDEFDDGSWEDDRPPREEWGRADKGRATGGRRFSALVAEYADDPGRQQPTSHAGFAEWLVEQVAELEAERDAMRAENARLRAVNCHAALLTALRDCEGIMDVCAERGIGDWLPPGTKDLWAVVHTAARAAIAKAEPESPQE